MEISRLVGRHIVKICTATSCTYGVQKVRNAWRVLGVVIPDEEGVNLQLLVKEI